MILKKMGFISDEKSAVIGQLYGGALRLYSNTQGLEEKNIDSYDLKDFNDLFHSRLEGMEKQVENILNTEK